jgi:hypothetical protein
VWLTRDSPVFCALVNSDGEMGDFLRLPYFLKRRNAWKEEERDRKVFFFCLSNQHASSRLNYGSTLTQRNDHAVATTQS